MSVPPDLRHAETPGATGAAATWVVRWDRSHPWGRDPHDRVDAALYTHYREVADVCGHIGWLHDGVNRQLPTPPPTAACGTGEQ